jgi:hypothetical protein
LNNPLNAKSAEPFHGFRALPPIFVEFLLFPVPVIRFRAPKPAEAKKAAAVCKVKRIQGEATHFKYLLFQSAERSLSRRRGNVKKNFSCKPQLLNRL